MTKYKQNYIPTVDSGGNPQGPPPHHPPPCIRAHSTARSHSIFASSLRPKWWCRAKPRNQRAWALLKSNLESGKWNLEICFLFVFSGCHIWESNKTSPTLLATVPWFSLGLISRRGGILWGEFGVSLDSHDVGGEVQVIDAVALIWDGRKLGTAYDGSSF